MKKKLLFAANTFDIGGIETSLLTLVNKLVEFEYDITIVLERKQGILLEKLDSRINVIEYNPSSSKNAVVRKMKNFLKRIIFFVKYNNRFDFSACYATYSIPDSFISRISSSNSALWCHADYLTLFNNNVQELKKFFKKRKFKAFKKIIFVSEEGKDSFVNIFPKMKDKTLVCNNLIDYNEIEKLAREKINIQRDNNCITFLNIGRQDEQQKKLSRLIEASSMLAMEGLKFKVLFVGDGPDSSFYKSLVKEKNIEDYIIFCGAKKNPYPYYSISDCVILTSEYEGYPVVFLESIILKKPIITTKVSDYKDIEGKYGMVTEKKVEDIYEKMKSFIQNGFIISSKFDASEYNNQIIIKLERIFRGK